MVPAPSDAHSLEGSNQLFNGGDGQDGGFGTWFGGEVRAGDWDVGDLAGKDFDLAVADVPGKASESRELQGPSVEGMAGIGDGDLTLAFLYDQRGITMGGVWRIWGRRR
jgi:hypothetical protein